MTTPLLMSEADAALDRVLHMFERGQHSATEMRVLLRLVDHHDAGIGELAEQLGCRPTEITRAGRRLTMRGLVRTYRAGRPEQTMMEITPSGRDRTNAAHRSACSRQPQPGGREHDQAMTTQGPFHPSSREWALRHGTDGH